MSDMKLKFGVVTEVDKRGRHKVKFPDENDLVSDWLPGSQDETVGTQSYKTFEIGTNVAVALDENASAGIVLTSFYADGDTPPAEQTGIWGRKFADGGEVWYDTNSGNLSLISSTSITVSVGGSSLTIDSSGIKIKGDVEIDGDLKVKGSTDLKSTKINGVTQTGS